MLGQRTHLSETNLPTFISSTMLLSAMLPLLATVMVTAPIGLTDACALHARQETGNADGTYPIMLPGDDQPSNPATVGYFINHVALNVKNVTRSIDW
jgi:hypothetical protein